MVSRAFIEAVALEVAELLGHRAPDRASDYVTVPEAAALLRCSSRKRVDDLLSQGKLTRIKDGRRTLIARTEVDRYLAGERTGPLSDPPPLGGIRRTD